MATVQTPFYLRLQKAVRDAGHIVHHESFPMKCEPAFVAEMIRDVLSTLEDFLNDPAVVEVDMLVHRRPSEAIGMWNAWLGGMGDQATRQALSRLADAAHESSRLGAPVVSELRKAVLSLLDDMVTYLGGEELQVPLQFHSTISVTRTKVDELGRKESLRLLDDAVDKIRSQQEKAEAGVAAISTAAGTAGGTVLFTHYDEFATAERTSASLFRRWTIGAVVVGGIAASASLVAPASDYPQLIQRLIVTAAIFGLAGYFARQAHQHRSLSNWASTLAVQLKTFEAFVSPVETAEARDRIRSTFASRAFGDHPAMKGEPTVTPSAAAMDTAVGWAAKLTAGGK
jgi:hypothetical protein